MYADTLQVELLKEQNKMSSRTDELEQELDVAKLENDLIREDLLKIEESRDQITESRAEQESDFLGRQLGHVQDRLDRST